MFPSTKGMLKRFCHIPLIIMLQGWYRLFHIKALRAFPIFRHAKASEESFCIHLVQQQEDHSVVLWATGFLVSMLTWMQYVSELLTKGGKNVPVAFICPYVKGWHSFILLELLFSTHRYLWMALGISFLVQYGETRDESVLEHSPEEKINSCNFKIS